MRFDSLLDSILLAVFTVSPGKRLSVTLIENKKKSDKVQRVKSLKFCKQMKLIFKQTHQRDNICETQDGKKTLYSLYFTKTLIKLTLELFVQQYRPPLVPNGILTTREIKRQRLDFLIRIRVNYQFSPIHPE